jgi:uroporphyrinogen III methyltransferase/synthase
MENGRSPDTPVAVIRWGTRPDQKTITGTLKDIAGIVKGKEIKPPAVMVVGEVVNLRKRLMWYEKKTMFGHRVLVTREHSGGFEPLEDLGAEMIEFPAIEIAPPKNYDELDSTINKIEEYNWIIFTSGNGVKYFFKRLLEKDKDIRDLKGIRICAIGTKTAAEIQRYGIKVDLMPDEFNAEGLISAVVQKSRSAKATSKLTNLSASALKGMKFLLPRAEKAREIFPEKVKELGGEIDVPAAYRAVKPEMHGKRLKRFLKEGRISVATFTSASTFDNFIEIMGADADELLRDVAIAVIGPVTARAVEKAGLKVQIMPETATIEAMVEAIIKWAAKRRNAV